MMTFKLQIVIGVALLAVFAILVNMIRKRSLELKYALVWMLMLVALFIFDCAPTLLNVVSGLIGIYAPVNMIFFLGFCFSLLIIFSLTVALSRLSNSIRTLDQMVALNEKRLQDLESQLGQRQEEDTMQEGQSEERGLSVDAEDSAADTVL
ncbi:MAG: DUF2304 domain-containing protein [Lachnospiraceae bacterium]|nr:DUF2304 domain-containing protein [Lachnospiraceae bacterium]